MTTCEVDLSKSEILIDEIQKIFKPPSDDSSIAPRLSKLSSKSNYNNCDVKYKDSNSSYNGKSNEEFDPRTLKNWKKPKPNSHDYCDSCSTCEGERLVCDRCPASFHLVCLDPPVDIEDAPVGVWYCNRCTAIMKEEDDKISNTSGTTNSKIENDEINQSIVTCNTVNKRSESSISSEITAEMSDEVPMKKLKLSLQSNKNISALQNVIDVLQCLNPKEFELPRNLIPSIKLPNTFKSPVEMRNKTVVTLENGVIPKPIVTCYECSRTCFYGTLVKCDYCPCYFHLDCLDPPLIQLPSRVERWMCPNHVEQVIDKSGMIETISLSERIRSYDKIKSKLNQINEFEVISALSSGTGFRLGITPKTERNYTERVKVPDAVKQIYREAKKLQSKDKKMTISAENNALLKSILNITKKNHDFDMSSKNANEILDITMESIKLLIAEKRIDLNKNGPYNFGNERKLPIYNQCLKTQPGNEKIKCRALLLPMDKDGITKHGEPIRITYRNFTLGSNEDNDCVITGCKYVSSHHASICYIDNHFCYELINYSRYGSVVDRLLYYNDLTQKDTHKSIHTSQHIKDIRNLLLANGKSNNNCNNKKMQSNNIKLNKPFLMASQRNVDRSVSSCTCMNFGYGQNVLNNCVESGWENSAPLKFGSIVEIGCKKFVFTSYQDVNGPANIMGGILDQSNNSKFDSFDYHNSSQHSYKSVDNNEPNIIPTTTFTSNTAVPNDEISKTTANVTKIPLIPVQKAKNIQIKTVKRTVPLLNPADDDEANERVNDDGDEGDDEEDLQKKTNISTIFTSSSSSLTLKDTKLNTEGLIKSDLDINRSSIDDEEDDDDDLDIDADDDDDNDATKQEL